MTPPATGSTVRIERLNALDARHVKALLALLDEYARSDEGGGTGLTEAAMARLPGALGASPHYVGWIAFEGDDPVGLINAFEGLSTFKALPLLNIHDIAVTQSRRGQGIGKQLLAQAEAHARARNCCKLTLEVLEGNQRAIGLYRGTGFAAYELDPAMGQAMFFEKWLT